MPKSSTSFKPGQSGNPKGRPRSDRAFSTIFNDLLNDKKSAIKDKDGKVIDTVTGKRLIAEAVFDIATNRNNPPHVRLAALNMMMERIEGKPAQTITADVETTVRSQTENIKKKIEKLSPEDRELYLELCEKQNDTDSE